jgi:regulator of sigma E protease
LSILYVFELIVAVGLIVFVHELGHFLSAKAFGVRVRKFALGLGPVIVRYVYGETEYSLRWIPLGGFVDLVGEHPEAEEAEDPRGLWHKPAWQKIVVFSAGVFMNAVLAVVLFTMAPILGVQIVPPTVGGVSSGLPAEKAGMEPDDRILSINGHAIQTFDDVIFNVMLRDAGTDFDIQVERQTSAGATEKLSFKMKSVREEGSPGPILGIEPPRDTTIAYFERPDSFAEQAGLQVGDRILSVNDAAVTTWRELTKALVTAKPGPVKLVIRRGEKEQTLSVDPANVKAYESGLNPQTLIARVFPNTPADKAGLKSGDVLTAIEDVKWPASKTLTDIVKASGDKELKLQVKRGDQMLDFKVTPTLTSSSARPVIGILMSMDFDGPPRVGEVAPKSAAAEAGIQPGDVITSMGQDNQPVRTWMPLLKVLVKAGDETVHLKIQRGNETVPIVLKQKPVVLDRLNLADASGDFLFLPMPRIYNPLTAAERGITQTYRWFIRTYMSLKQMSTRQMGTEGVAGPVFIAKAAYSYASRGLGTLFDFTGMITVSIAVLNFLPLPPFDGGHVLFTLFEAIRRKPVSMKARTVAWIIGWVLVLGVFVAVTFRDVFYR